MALLAVGLMYLLGLGAAPFLDPPEGFHAVIAQTLRLTGDWVTLRVDGVRYFDKPPLLYWLMAFSFHVVGPTEAAARVWPALAAVGIAAVTGRIGVILGGPRVGLLSGLMVAANMGMFVFGREVKPDMLFILFIVLAFGGFVIAYRGSGRGGLALFYAGLGLATLTKDVLGAIGPLVIVAVFLWLTRERPYSTWAPWWGVAILLAIALPWYLAVELRNDGFLWYTFVDNHLLNFARLRAYPDEDIPLGAVQFMGVTVLAFLPWVLSLPWALRRSLKPPWPDANTRLWALLGLWAVIVVGFFAASPFKLPHYGLPAFPALALLAARAWDDCIEALPGAASPRALMVPVLATFAALSVVLGLAALDRLPLPPGALQSVDVAARNLAARGLVAASSPLEAYLPVLTKSALLFLIATISLAVAAWRRWPAAGVGVTLAAMIAFLPMAGEGMAQFARGRSVRPITGALVRRVAAGDEIVHEGALENSASMLLALGRPVHVVDGLQSNLAFGATFADARDVFWSVARLEQAWTAPGRCFLVSTVEPSQSVSRALQPLHLIARGGGRWLYSNRPD
ncbi:MAG TPA: glycosyltransferase family 39 protein [Methylomirabilota bacterium]|nr:glycosyltransferase family 39 protein [Methylomirabilota bacterium]